jgi:hypothetical protein
MIDGMMADTITAVVATIFSKQVFVLGKQR